MGELFGVKSPAISKHVKNIFEGGETLPVTTVSKMETVQKEGGRSVVRGQRFDDHFVEITDMIGGIPSAEDQTNHGADGDRERRWN